MKSLKEIGCSLIGWNPAILKECGEASQRQFRKLLSAICIMMVLWGTIGYCFAERYIGIESIPFKLLVVVAFMFIILCVERVIILTVGKARLMTVMRVMMALCMAVLGSCIFDQIIFSNDIQQTIQERREEKIISTINKRLSVYDTDIKRINAAIDSISKVNDALYRELEAKPTTTITTVSTSQQVAGIDANGKPIKTNVQSVNKTVVPNPRAEQAKGNEEQLKIYNAQLDELRNDKKNIDKTVREDFSKRPTGFIEELEATLAVVSQSPVSLTFYIILFMFLTFLELFVLTIKTGDSKCDYELIVEHQLELKKNVMLNTENTLKK